MSRGAGFQAQSGITQLAVGGDDREVGRGRCRCIQKAQPHPGHQVSYHCADTQRKRSVLIASRQGVKRQSARPGCSLLADLSPKAAQRGTLAELVCVYDKSHVSLQSTFKAE